MADAERIKLRREVFTGSRYSTLLIGKVEGLSGKTDTNAITVFIPGKGNVRVSAGRSHFIHQFVRLGKTGDFIALCISRLTKTESKRVARAVVETASSARAGKRNAMAHMREKTPFLHASRC